MVAELATAAVVLVAMGAEMLHARRCQRLSALAFGPLRRPALWARLAPALRVASLGAVCWGLVTLMQAKPKIHEAVTFSEGELRHLVLVLDVSPSMRLEDAGPENDKSRRSRAADVLRSFFRRVTMEQYRVSIVAVYSGAKPVVIDTKDIDVVHNVLNELPMEYAFTSGKTDIFAGLKEAATIAKPWQPRSTTLLVVSDGDTVPATGMPKMPASVGHVVVVGVGDPVTGRFIDGRQSRQDTSTLRQIALRLQGTYHNGNEKHLSTELLNRLTKVAEPSPFEKLTRREYALIACGLGAFVLAFLPVLLHYFGTRWRPGVWVSRESEIGRKNGEKGETSRSDLEPTAPAV